MLLNESRLSQACGSSCQACSIQIHIDCSLEVRWLKLLGSEDYVPHPQQPFHCQVDCHMRLGRLVRTPMLSLPQTVLIDGIESGSCRVVDGTSKRARGMLQVVMDNLFALYPPAPPTEEERRLEQQQKAAAAAKLVRADSEQAANLARWHRPHAGTKAACCTRVCFTSTGS